MLCPVCKDDKKATTGVLELVTALSVTVSSDGVVSRNSAVILDEYLACNNCLDLECATEDCVSWHWESDSKDRRIILDATAPPTPSIGAEVSNQ